MTTATETIRIFVEIDAELVAWINAAEAAALEKVTDRRWVNAIKKAAAFLSSDLNAAAWHAESNTLCITSPQSGKTYEANAAGCGCEANAAGKPCWHRAAARLVQRAYEARTATREAARVAALVQDDEQAARAERLIALRMLNIKMRRRRMYA